MKREGETDGDCSSIFPSDLVKSLVELLKDKIRGAAIGCARRTECLRDRRSAHTLNVQRIWLTEHDRFAIVLSFLCEARTTNNKIIKCVSRSMSWLIATVEEHSVLKALLKCI